MRPPDAITLSGPPGSMSAIVQMDAGGVVVVPIAIKLGDGPVICRAHVRPFGRGTSEIRLRLPGETPPGRYSGEGPFAGEPRAVTVEVEPVVRIRLHPKRTTLEAAGGAGPGFAVTVVNTGNVSVAIPEAAVFDLDDEESQDRALGRAMRARLVEGERLVDRVFDEIRESHGGEARLAVVEGAGPLEPGETRTLRCQLVLPTSVQAGRTYTGGWEIGNTTHLFTIEVTKNGPRSRGRSPS